MANNFSSSSHSLSSSDKETVVKNMQEVFSHLDPEVIYIVLSECDFKGTKLQNNTETRLHNMPSDCWECVFGLTWLTS